MKYRKKPVVVEAFQMTREHLGNGNSWPQWLHESWNDRNKADYHIIPCDPEVGAIAIRTPEGAMVVSFDDWILKGVKGELYPCKPDIFEATHESITDNSLEYSDDFNMTGD